MVVSPRSTLQRAYHWGKAPPATLQGRLQACNTVDTKLWEAIADDRKLWNQQVSQGLKSGKAAIRVKNDARGARRIAGPTRPTTCICVHISGLQQRLQT